MTFNAIQIAQLIGGTIEGNPDTAVQAFGKIEEAKAGELSFLANPKYEEFLYTTQASLVIVNQSLQLKQPVAATLIRVPDAYSAFAVLLEAYQQANLQQLTGTEQPSFVHPSAQQGSNVYIGAFAYISENVSIGNGSKIYPGAFVGKKVSIGNNTIIHPGVIIYHDCVIGSNVIIHAGSVIGSDGFGFAPQTGGTFKKIPQTGNVVIEDHVEIGANTTIDRATIGSTIIHTGVKLDNLLQVAHNVEIGSNTVIAAQTGVSGSTKIGENVMIGGQVGIAGHLHIASGTKISGQSGITKTIKAPNTTLSGKPAMDLQTSLKIQAHTRQLPQLENRIKELERIIQELKQGK
jgi:UDP-3-O-[3-hydroxymyristoyl] glucosamine N-acyltransferase